MSYEDKDVQGLARTIDRLNAAFQGIVCDQEKLKEFFDVLSRDKAKSKLFDDFVNDRYEDLTPDIGQQNYSVLNVHGHVGEVLLRNETPQGWRYENLDTDLAKNESKSKGKYLVHFSTEPKKENILDVNLQLIEILKNYIMNHTWVMQDFLGKTTSIKLADDDKTLATHLPKHIQQQLKLIQDVETSADKSPQHTSDTVQRLLTLHRRARNILRQHQTVTLKRISKD